MSKLTPPEWFDEKTLDNMERIERVVLIPSKARLTLLAMARTALYLTAEVKRLHEKYDLQLLVQRNDQLTVEVVELRKELARQASSHGLYITQNVEPKMGELKGEIARLRSTLELIAEGPAEGWVGLAWKALTPEGEKDDDT